MRKLPLLPSSHLTPLKIARDSRLERYFDRRWRKSKLLSGTDKISFTPRCTIYTLIQSKKNGADMSVIEI